MGSLTLAKCVVMIKNYDFHINSALKSFTHFTFNFLLKEKLVIHVNIYLHYSTVLTTIF